TYSLTFTHLRSRGVVKLGGLSLVLVQHRMLEVIEFAAGSGAPSLTPGHSRVNPGAAAALRHENNYRLACGPARAASGTAGKVCACRHHSSRRFCAGG